MFRESTLSTPIPFPLARERKGRAAKKSMKDIRFMGILVGFIYSHDVEIRAGSTITHVTGWPQDNSRETLSSTLLVLLFDKKLFGENSPYSTSILDRLTNLFFFLTLVRGSCTTICSFVE